MANLSLDRVDASLIKTNLDLSCILQVRHTHIQQLLGSLSFPSMQYPSRFRPPVSRMDVTVPQVCAEPDSGDNLLILAAGKQLQGIRQTRGVWAPSTHPACREYHRRGGHGQLRPPRTLHLGSVDAGFVQVRNSDQ